MGLRNPFKKAQIDPNEIRYCKKCGTELASDNKRSLCANCREKRAQKIKESVLAGGSIAGLLAFGYNEYQKLRHRDDDEDDDESV